MKKIFLVAAITLLGTHQAEARVFGGWSICEALFNYIVDTIPKGSTILELGSGKGTGQLVKHFTVYSIEHSPKYLNKYHDRYIYAPLVDMWYDTDVLTKQLPKDYDLILIDGPPKQRGRSSRDGFLKHIHLFRQDVPIIVDDVNRPSERNLMQKIAAYLGREYTIIECGKKKFAVILAQGSL